MWRVKPVNLCGLIQQATIVQITEEIIIGFDRKVSVHNELQFVVYVTAQLQTSQSAFLTHVQCKRHQQWAHEHQKWNTEKWKKEAWSDKSCFL